MREVKLNKLAFIQDKPLCGMCGKEFKVLLRKDVYMALHLFNGLNCNTCIPPEMRAPVVLDMKTWTTYFWGVKDE